MNVTCPHCGREVPEGAFCAACGRPLTAHPTARWHSFAANPSEHVLHPSIASTLFPHVPQRQSTIYRLALLVVAAALLLGGYLRLTGPVVAIAAAGVPLIFLIYLIESRVFASDEAYSLGVTAGLGAVFGVIWAYFAGRYISETYLVNLSLLHASTGRIILAGIVLPLVAQALMLVGPVILRLTRPYDEVLDGFAAGAASALGFALTATLVGLLPEVESGPLSAAGDIDSAIRALLHGMLVPLIYAGTTGLVAAAIFLRRGPTNRDPYGWLTGLWPAVFVAAVIRAVLGMASLYVLQISADILIYAGVAALLLFLVRIALHHMLLAEPANPPGGSPLACFHCELEVPRMAFCPSCGGATTAMPKLGAGVENRDVR